MVVAALLTLPLFAMSAQADPPPSGDGTSLVGPPDPMLGAGSSQPGLTVTPVVTDLNLPVTMAFAAHDRVYVAEKAGVVRMLTTSGEEAPVTTLDLRREVHDYSDRGLLGLTLHPQFDHGSPYLYVLYSHDRDPFGPPTVPRWGGSRGDDDCPSPPGALQDGCTTTAQLVRYTVNARGVADPASALVLLDGSGSPDGGWCHQFPSHSIGTVEFGPDGMLYVGAGDGADFTRVDYGQLGGSAGSPTPANPCADRPGSRGTALAPGTSWGGSLRSQAVRNAPATGYVTWDGAILRVDPATGKAPASNPLVGNGIAGDDRIIAYGLRNPFRFGFRPGSDQLWLGDVGWGAVEEINSFRTGRAQSTVPNFGWPCYEGSTPQDSYKATGLAACNSLYANTTSTIGGVSSPLVNPVYEWTRDGEKPAPGCSISGSGSAVGGAFATNSTWPSAMKGAYVFADYARGCIAALPLLNGQPDTGHPLAVVTDVYAVSIKSGPGGDLYYADIGTGSIKRIRSTSGNQPPVAAFTATPDQGTPPLTVSLDATASSDPDGLEKLTYSWDLDGDRACNDATGAKLTHTFTTRGAKTVGLCVRDPLGETGRATRTIQVDNTTPTVTATSSADTAGWKVGDELVFTAVGHDADQPTLPDGAYTWAFDLRHCANEGGKDCHTHPLTGTTGRVARLIAPDHEYYAYIHAKVTVTDDAGAPATASVDAKPRISTLTLATSPSGVPVSAGVVSGRSPLIAKFLENGVAQLVVPVDTDVTIPRSKFTGWSDAPTEGRIRSLHVPAGSSSYTALFAKPPVIPDPPTPPPNTAPWIGAPRVRPTHTTIRRRGKVFVFTARVADANGLRKVYGRIDIPGRGTRWVSMRRIAGSTTNGTWRGKVWVSHRRARTGRWSTRVSAMDNKGALHSVAGPRIWVRKR